MPRLTTRRARLLCWKKIKNLAGEKPSKLPNCARSLDRVRRPKGAACCAPTGFGLRPQWGFVSNRSIGTAHDSKQLQTPKTKMPAWSPAARHRGDGSVSFSEATASAQMFGDTDGIVDGHLRQTRCFVWMIFCMRFSRCSMPALAGKLRPCDRHRG